MRRVPAHLQVSSKRYMSIDKASSRMHALYAIVLSWKLRSSEKKAKNDCAKTFAAYIHTAGSKRYSENAAQHQPNK